MLCNDMSGPSISEQGVTSVKLLACSEFLAPDSLGTSEPCARNEAGGSVSSPARLRNESNLASDFCCSKASTKLKQIQFAVEVAHFGRKTDSRIANWENLSPNIIVGIIYVHVQYVTRKAKFTAKASGLAKPG